MNLDFWSHIPSIAQNLFLGSLLLFALSSASFYFNKKIFLPLLGLSALSIACAFAMAIPWLYPWDEQFHALVGKNLAKNPLHPILIDLNPSLLTNQTWADQRTWLHKQPLFLYQIALSVKIFGNTAFAVRFPSVLLHVAGVLALFDMGRILWNQKVGFLAATLFLFSFYPLGLISGRIGTDHNDSVFMIYVLLSFWAYFRFTANPSKKWAHWIGIFVGLAILTKWLVGLLVFAPWGLFALLALWKKDRNQILFLLRALLVAIIVAVPWQIYIHTYFPKEANFEMAYNTRHFFEVIEGHGGDWKFHFENLWFTFFSPKILVGLMLLSLGVVFYKKSVSRNYWVLWIATLVIFLFFTLSKTKMYSFVIPAYPLVILIISFGLVKAIDFVRNAYVRPLIFVLVGCFLILKVFKYERTVTEFGFVPETQFFGNRVLFHEQLNYLKTKGTNDPKTIIVNANLRAHGNIQWMFFTDNKAVFLLPEKEKIAQFKKSGYKVKCIQWNDPLPEYILDDNSITKLPFK
jgi:uncharacterized membrane protein